jgi:FAD/FMN-containing dehydrogenase
MRSAHVLVEVLSRGLPGDRLVVDPDVLAAISHDDAEWAPTEQAAVGVRARTEAEVQHVVRTCAELGTPVVPRGAGTGLSGGANAVGGCVILDLSRMNQIVEIDADNLVAALELLDRVCLEAVEDWKHLGIEADAEALLLARVDTPGDSGAAEAADVAATMAGAGALWVEQSTDDAEAEALFDARRLAYPALERLGPVLTEDVCVPRSKVPAMLGQIKAIAAQHGVQIATIAHTGDGNLHPLLVTPPGDDDARLAAQAAFEEFLDAAIALGGTVTGEHGVGILKRDGMRRELDPGSLALQSAVRSTLDPLQIFNPGKG